MSIACTKFSNGRNFKHLKLPWHIVTIAATLYDSRTLGIQLKKLLNSLSTPSAISLCAASAAAAASLSAARAAASEPLSTEVLVGDDGLEERKVTTSRTDFVCKTTTCNSNVPSSVVQVVLVSRRCRGARCHHQLSILCEHANRYTCYDFPSVYHFCD